MRKRRARKKKIPPPTFDYRQIKDVRYKNWCLALSLMIQELWKLEIWEVDQVLMRWSVNRKRFKGKHGFWKVGLLFPQGLKREQWFYNDKGKPYKKTLSSV